MNGEVWHRIRLFFLREWERHWAPFWLVRLKSWKAMRVRKVLGGGMRQIVWQQPLYALDNNRERKWGPP
jgi:hypothetical protein